MRWRRTDRPDGDATRRRYVPPPGRLLALRPVELLLDLRLGEAAAEERLLGRQDHVRVAADVGDRVVGREAELVGRPGRRSTRRDPSARSSPRSPVPMAARRSARTSPGSRRLAPSPRAARGSRGRRAYDTPFRKTAFRGAPSRRSRFIIETNGALPVPDEMNRWVRSSSGSRVNLPFGPIIRIRCPSGSRHSSGVNSPPSTSRTYIS